MYKNKLLLPYTRLVRPSILTYVFTSNKSTTKSIVQVCISNWWLPILFVLAFRLFINNLSRHSVCHTLTIEAIVEVEVEDKTLTISCAQNPVLSSTVDVPMRPECSLSRCNKKSVPAVRTTSTNRALRHL